MGTVLSSQILQLRSWKWEDPKTGWTSVFCSPSRSGSVLQSRDVYLPIYHQVLKSRWEICALELCVRVLQSHNLGSRPVWGFPKTGSDEEYPMCWAQYPSSRWSCSLIGEIRCWLVFLCWCIFAYQLDPGVLRLYNRADLIKYWDQRPRTIHWDPNDQQPSTNNF